MFRFFRFAVLVLILSIGAEVEAQKGYYSNTTDFLSVENPFSEDADQHVYKIDGVTVKEFYKMPERKFIGYYIGAKSIDTRKLHVVMYTASVKKLIRTKSVKEAMTFVFDNITPGMSVEEVVEILGKPERFKYAISGSNQLLYYYYDQGVFEKLVFKDDLLVTVD